MGRARPRPSEIKPEDTATHTRNRRAHTHASTYPRTLHAERSIVFIFVSVEAPTDNQNKPNGRPYTFQHEVVLCYARLVSFLPSSRPRCPRRRTGLPRCVACSPLLDCWSTARRDCVTEKTPVFLLVLGLPGKDNRYFGFGVCSRLRGVVGRMENFEQPNDVHFCMASSYILKPLKTFL